MFQGGREIIRRNQVGLMTEMKKVAKSVKGGEMCVDLQLGREPKTLSIYKKDGKFFFVPIAKEVRIIKQK